MTIQFEQEKAESIFIRITEEIKQELENLAKKNNTNLSEVARKLIIEGLKIAKEK